MKMPEIVKEIFNNEPVHQLATASKSGVPNICNAGARYLLDDETIVIIDNYMLKTLANIAENPIVAVLIRSGRQSFQIKGRCSYLTSGRVYEEARAWMKAKGEKYPAKGALQIKVEEVFNSNGGDGAGGKVQE